MFISNCSQNFGHFFIIVSGFQPLPDVFNMNSSVGREDFSLSGDLLQPLLDTELLPEAVADAVAGNLVSLAVDVLDVAVVRPLVAYVESGRYWTAVGIPRNYLKMM